MTEVTQENAFEVYTEVLRPAGILIDTRDALPVVMHGKIPLGRFISFTEAVRAASLYLRNA